jgi:aspartate aminotransferase-like enzyme
MIHHRTPEFDQIFKRVRQQIKKIFCTEQDVFLLTCTGSGGMEALLVNTLSPGDKVLAIVSGKFGERWAEMAKTFGAQVTDLQVPWGEPVDIRDVEIHLQKNPSTRLVLCQACETSTGTANPIKKLGEIIRNFPETLFLVDGITAIHGRVDIIKAKVLKRFCEHHSHQATVIRD